MRPIAQQTILYADSMPSPLGQIALAASIKNGRGIVPSTPYRVYGRYAIVYITQGRGYYRDALGTERTITAGDAIFVFPDLAHTYGPNPGAFWSELYLVFHGPAFDAWRTMGVLNSRQCVYHLSPIEEWIARLRTITDLSGPATPSHRAIQVSRLLELITEIAALSPTEKREPGSEWTSRACMMLTENLADDLDGSLVAEQMGMTYETFRKKFQQQLGISPMRYRAERRIDAACELMQYTSMTGIQIAETLGYTDEYYFSKRFKLMRGETPSEFRRRLR